ncbi:hypothetical protein D3C71_1688880 [compost metagenome]
MKKIFPKCPFWMIIRVIRLYGYVKGEFADFGRDRTHRRSGTGRRGRVLCPYRRSFSKADLPLLLPAAWESNRSGGCGTGYSSEGISAYRHISPYRELFFLAI